MDCCVDLSYEMVWSCFEKYVSMRFSRCGQKLLWITSELSCVKNKERACKKRCLEDKTIDDCECKHLQWKFLSLREEYQLMHGWAYDDYRNGIEEAIKSDPKILCWLPVSFAFRRSFYIWS
jgi:hypothetical protein